MIIHYIYLKDKVTEKQTSINLSSNFICEFDRENQRYIKKENEDFVENLFGSNIENITALVGKNGSGKTNTIKTIIDILIEKKDPNIEYFLNLYDETLEEELIVTNISSLFNISSNINYKKKKIEVLFRDTSIFYNSNVFDGNSIFDSTRNVINLSTNNLVNRYIEQGLTLGEMRAKEASNHIEFVILYKEYLNITSYLKLPRNIEMNLNLEDFVYDNLTIQDYFSLRGISIKIKENKDISDRDYYQNMCLKTYLYHYILWIDELLNVLTSTKIDYLTEEEIEAKFNDFWEDIFQDLNNENLNRRHTKLYEEINLKRIYKELHDEINLLNNVINISDYEELVKDVINSIQEILREYTITEENEAYIVEKFSNFFLKEQYNKEVLNEEVIESLKLISYDLQIKQKEKRDLKTKWIKIAKETFENKLTNKSFDELNKKLIKLINENIHINKTRKNIKQEIDLKIYNLNEEFFVNDKIFEELNHKKRDLNKEFNDIFDFEHTLNIDSENEEMEFNDTFDFEHTLNIGSENEEMEFNDTFDYEERLIMELEEDDILFKEDSEELTIKKEDLINALDAIINEKCNGILMKIKLLDFIIKKIRFEARDNFIELDTPELKDFIKRFPQDKIFNYNWRNMSSGEISFISFLSRLYKAKKLLKNKKNILLFIDEGELYFHPQWQKSYLDLLIRALSEIFKDNKIQVIITSHSPFIITDLPSYSVHTMNDSHISKVLEQLKLDKTFAANIQDLYTNAFFLTGGLTGDFAKNVINKWIDEIIHDNKQAFVKYNYYLNAFNQIGEPLVREKCLSLLEEKRNEYLIEEGKKDKVKLVEKYKEIILRLEQEINETD